MKNSRKYIAPFLFLLFAGSIVIPSCRKAQDFSDENYDERLSGGTQTVFSEGTGAFANVFPTLSGALLDAHDLGDANFETTYITAPAPKFQGLGSLYNSNACVNCHVNDGRGKPIDGNEPLTSMLFRVSVPGTNEHGGPLAAPGFGVQLQDKATFGHAPEAGASVTWYETSVFFNDGDSVMLREPIWTITNPYIPLPAGFLHSPRVARPVFGLGLLEQIDDATLNSLTDESDVNGDGISGKTNYVWDQHTKRMAIGRFGWKAESPSLIHQVALAFNEDIGLTNYIFKEENSKGQTQEDNFDHYPEVPDSVLNAVAVYVQTLAVPARRNVTDENVKRGKKVFIDSKCASCHVPTLRTKTNVAFPQASNQLIHPYTDLLLHNMGSALSDNRATYEASGSEWRTPPLWGIGLTKVTNGHTYFLHDGRARSFMEAILWHGGEATSAVNYIKALSKTDRDALIAFLNSL